MLFTNIYSVSKKSQLFLKVQTFVKNRKKFLLLSIYTYILSLLTMRKDFKFLVLVRENYTAAKRIS